MEVLVARSVQTSHVVEGIRIKFRAKIQLRPNLIFSYLNLEQVKLNIDNPYFFIYNLTSKIAKEGIKLMSGFSTTKMSSKGQIVIPEDIRSIMGLTTGDNFIILAEKDVVILKLIKKPSLNEYSEIIKRSRLQAKQAGIKIEDLDQSIKDVRSQNRDPK